MDMVTQFQMLGRKQLAIQEGIELLRQLQVELSRTRATADVWGRVAILANVTLIPLNVIVNAFELKAASSVYQILVQQLYGKVAKSGTRLDGHGKVVLAALKEAIVGELKRKALTQYIPGVNILVGLTEDSLAVWQTIQQVQSGGREMSAQAMQVELKIIAANQQLVQIGVKRAEIVDRGNIYGRTA